MTNILDEIKKRLQLWHEERADRIENARQAALDAEARRAVQVMEYNGELFISVNGVPLIATEDLKGSLLETVTHGRENYKDWKEEQLWKNRMTVMH